MKYQIRAVLIEPIGVEESIIQPAPDDKADGEARAPTEGESHRNH
ncbi:hypothetical protein [Arthrobacter sp. NPDC057013]